MSIAYEKRKKAIRNEKRRLAEIDGLDSFGHIPSTAFYYLQANWQSKVDGPPTCRLSDLIGAL